MKAIVLGIIVLFGSVSVACGMGNKEIVFRPVTLRVFDAETKRPLEGISVKVVNTTFNPKRKMFRGLVIEQTDNTTYRIYNYQTDANGLVEIPQFSYTLGANDFLLKQDILINIDAIGMTNREAEKEEIFDAVVLYSKEGGLFYRPESNYKAGKITSYPYLLDPKDYYQLEKTKPYYTEIFNGHEVPPLTEQELKIEPTSFFCDHEEFEIYLERFVDPEVSTN